MDVPSPPRPLILAGWVYSSDVEKRERWHATLAWAKAWEFEHIIGDIDPMDMHMVAVPTNYDTGPMGGPMFQEWTSDPKRVPSTEELERAMRTLLQRWIELAGDELAKGTSPICFSGPKKRKLIVHADPAMTPPWGTWNSLADGPDRRHFTRLRAAINDAIVPIEIDHIDFVHPPELERP